MTQTLVQRRLGGGARHPRLRSRRGRGIRSDYLVAVSDGAYTFGFDELTQSAGARWTDSRFIPATGDWMNSTCGHLQLHDSDTGRADVIAGLLAGGKGIGLEGEPERVAEFIAWLASRDQFPDDGSVVLSGWRRGQVTLPPGTTAETLLDAPRP